MKLRGPGQNMDMAVSDACKPARCFGAPCYGACCRDCSAKLIFDVLFMCAGGSLLYKFGCGQLASKTLSASVCVCVCVCVCEFCGFVGVRTNASTSVHVRGRGVRRKSRYSADPVRNEICVQPSAVLVDSLGKPIKCDKVLYTD